MSRDYDERTQLRLMLRQSAEKAARSGQPAVSRFLPVSEESTALHEAYEAGCEVSFDGGWPDAERVQACFHDADEEPVFTGVGLRITWNSRFSPPEHRALMGSLMALGIDRSCFGDLLLQEDAAFLMALPAAAEQLPAAWREAGRISIRVEKMDEAPQLRRQEGELMRATVASLRLDSIVSAGLRLSRAKAAEMVQAGLVSVDHRVELRCDRLIAEGQTLSLRGHGRVILRETGERTRKDRIPVVLECLVHH